MFFSAIYCDENGEILKKGNIVYRKIFADTLKGIAEIGPDYFYKGQGAERLIKDVKKFGKWNLR